MSSENDTTQQPVSRRRFLKTSAAAAVVAIVAGVGGYLAYSSTSPARPAQPAQTEQPAQTAQQTTQAPAAATSQQPAQTQGTVGTTGPVRYIGASWVMYPEVAQEYKRQFNEEVQFTILGFFETNSRAIATKGLGWDVIHQYTGVMAPIVFANPPVIQPTPVDKIKNWKDNFPDNITGWLLNPEKALGYLAGGALAPRLKQLLWKEEGKTVQGMPLVFNYDTVGYLPEFVPFREEGSKKSISLGETFKPDWKGHVAWQNEPMQSVMFIVLYLMKSGQLKPDFNFDGTFQNVTRTGIDAAVDFLTPYVKSQHVRAFWSDYGQAVNLFSSKEVWIQQCWQPVVMDTRRAGVPAYYSFLQEGSLFWYSPDMISIQATEPHLSDIYNFINFRMSDWWATFIIRNGYSVPTYPSPATKKAFGPEQWGWHYGGQRTYKTNEEAIKQIWSARPELQNLDDRLAQALFLPDQYKWNREEGTPNSKGNLRDMGAVEERTKNVGFFPLWADEAPYALQRWDNMKAAAKT